MDVDAGCPTGSVRARYGRCAVGRCVCTVPSLVANRSRLHTSIRWQRRSFTNRRNSHLAVLMIRTLCHWPGGVRSPARRPIGRPRTTRPHHRREDGGRDPGAVGPGRGVAPSLFVAALCRCRCRCRRCLFVWRGDDALSPGHFSWSARRARRLAARRCGTPEN